MPLKYHCTSLSKHECSVEKFTYWGFCLLRLVVFLRIINKFEKAQQFTNECMNKVGNAVPDCHGYSIFEVYL